MSIVHVVRTPEPASLPLRRTSVSLVESTAYSQIGESSSRHGNIPPAHISPGDGIQF